MSKPIVIKCRLGVRNKTVDLGVSMWNSSRGYEFRRQRVVTNHQQQTYWLNYDYIFIVTMVGSDDTYCASYSLDNVKKG